MQRLRLFFLLLMCPVALFAQQKTKILLKYSERGSAIGDIAYLYKPVFMHENATLTCDSAVFYSAKNIFEAFRNVHIVQGDTINIYSDHLNYDGNTRIAHLTNNVKMIDKESVLTTNILDYNMGTKVGTYVNSGKIVNKDVTLTSTNGYYFSNSRDAYFRYNVVVVTPQSRITSDTLRYNTQTNWAFFYGPTNIKGKGDNLYTENGAYNTKTEYAYFGKKNLYTNGSKSLKGDSLYYDGIAGYGKAVRNIIFRDTSDKTVLYGELGYYYKKDERALVTKNAYVGMGTNDSITVGNKLVPDSIWMGADTLETQMVKKGGLTLIESPVLKKDNELGPPESEQTETNLPKQPNSAPKPKVAIPAKNLPKPEKKASRKKNKKGKLPAEQQNTLKDSLKTPAISNAVDSMTTEIKDSIVSKDFDSLKTGTLELFPKNIDTLRKGLDSLKKIPDSLKKKSDSLLNKGAVLKDSLPLRPEDTVKTRIIKAYHHVRVFKTNMQARADSLFYTSADSTLRWYGSPILWSQGSQQTGDTLYLRLKNKKLNTLQVIESAFLVNVNADSARYNQIKGKLITAFFKNGSLSNMFVDGNAESIYFIRNKDSVYTDMSQTVSARIKILFKNKEISDLLTIKDPEGIRVPIAELQQENFLTGFTWKPELRPLSKKEVIRGRSGVGPSVKAGGNPKSASGKKTVAADEVAKGLKRRLEEKQTKLDPGSSKQNINQLDSIPSKIDSIPLKADSLLKKQIPDRLKKQ